MNSKNFNYIKNRMSLRNPQIESLEILAKIVEKIKLNKEDNNEENLNIVREIAPICTDFERNFTSICFSLATGVGKTRLMAAFMVYLYKEKGIKNFMVIAPNLTIYNKLIKDFGDQSYEKYCFRGISEFYNSNIITGENYKKSIEGQTNMYSDITINIFNISKINAETKGGKEPQIKRLSEYIGDSYFNFLAEQEDLVILMDESHHYRADRGMQVLNELNPVLGLELTATPQVEKSGKSIKFKNVVYEYSLAKAINDGFVKVPHVATRKNFNNSNYKTEMEKDIVKLKDGIIIHEDTKIELENFANDNKIHKIKPFVLVIAKDTDHAEELLKIIKSDKFFNADYKNKVIIVHSNQKGKEKDENIEQLVSLEKEGNKIEIVIHVNMLKEGWDVNNLYTIIPLRASASDTLTEQTMGRGLRLPYGAITGNEKVDRLTIVSHDKYERILEIANEEGSLIRKENIIEITETNFNDRKEAITIQDIVNEEIEKSKIEITSKENWKEDEECVSKYSAIEAKSIVYDTVFKESAEYQVNSIEELKNNKIKDMVINFYQQKVNNDTQESCEGFCDDVIKAIEQDYENIIDDLNSKIIEIPRIIIMTSPDIECYFEDFDLDTSALNYRPSEQSILITNLSNNQTTEIGSKGNEYLPEDLEHTLVDELCNKPEIDYDKSSELLFKLVKQAIEKLKKYLSEEETIAVIKEQKYNIANYIYSQMKEHLIVSESKILGTKVLPFVRIENHSYSKTVNDDLLDYHQTVEPSELKKKVFTGFKKACHNKYKFDSTQEKDFTVCLEISNEVKKWMRPTLSQFNIVWNRKGSLYEPDFIVETDNSIYMVEVKKDTEINTEEVQSKKKAGELYCELATDFNKKNGKKAWKYILIPATEVKFNRDFNEYINLFYN